MNRLEEYCNSQDANLWKTFADVCEDVRSFLAWIKEKKRAGGREEEYWTILQNLGVFIDEKKKYWESTYFSQQSLARRDQKSLALCAILIYGIRPNQHLIEEMGEKLSISEIIHSFRSPLILDGHEWGE